MTQSQKAAVFIDRDGVINKTYIRDGVSYPPYSLAEFEILPGVGKALERLAELGLPLIVVTNQPDVARGSQAKEVIESFHDLLRKSLPLTAIYSCYHDNADNCDCRKPKAGMMLQAAREHDVNLKNSFMIGDRWSDIAAGAAAGCCTFLINLPYSQCERCTPDHKVADLGEAAIMIERMVRERST